MEGREASQNFSNKETYTLNTSKLSYGIDTGCDNKSTNIQGAGRNSLKIKHRLGINSICYEKHYFNFYLLLTFTANAQGFLILRVRPLLLEISTDLLLK